jgi:hypothetical protein
MQTHDLLSTPNDKAVEYICSRDFELWLKLALSSHERGWKAAWLINQAAKSCRLPLQKYDGNICKAIPGKSSNQKRELLKLLEQVELHEENEGIIFDVAISCWEDLKAQSSCRMVGFRLMTKVAKKHPELICEIKSMSDERFLGGLTNGIKNSILKRLNEL